MPWQGNAEISIDRFDVRAHLDYIAEVQIEENTYPEVSTRYLLRFFDCLAHPNLSATFATDQK